MPEFKEFYNLQTGDIAPAGTFSLSYTAIQDYIIRKILAVEKTGATIGLVPITIKIDEIPLTKVAIPAIALGTNYENAVELNYPFKKDQKILISGTNEEAASRNIAFILILDKA